MCFMVFAFPSLGYSRAEEGGGPSAGRAGRYRSASLQMGQAQLCRHPWAAQLFSRWTFSYLLFFLLWYSPFIMVCHMSFLDSE